MKHIFIVLIDFETQSESNSFVNYLKNMGYGWWHRTNNSWIITSSAQVTEEDIRIAVTKYFPKRTTFVVNMRSRNWTGWGVNEHFDWFKDNWG